MVEYIDALVGRIVGKVHELGISQNTLIIFTGDNGTDRRVISDVNGKNIQGNKGNTTSYGTHVPLIAYWDNVIKPGQVNDNLIDFTDFIPTFMEVAGANIPAGFHSDGISFYKQLLGKRTKVRDWIYCYYNPNWGNRVPATWVHNKRWKLYSDDQFYDLKNDPEELNAIPEAALTPKAGKTKKQFTGIIEGYNEEQQKKNNP